MGCWRLPGAPCIQHWITSWRSLGTVIGFCFGSLDSVVGLSSGRQARGWLGAWRGGRAQSGLGSLLPALSWASHLGCQSFTFLFSEVG